MNKVILMGRLTRDPEIRWTQGQDQRCMARYTLAVNRPYKKEGEEQKADFISCVTWGKPAEFAEKYLRQGIKLLITGRIQTGSYTNKEGQKVYTTDVIVEEQEFAESKGKNEGSNAAAGDDQRQQAPEEGTGFIDIPEGIENDLPFN